VAPVPDTDSHTVIARFLRISTLVKCLTPTRSRIHIILGEIRQTSGSELIRQSGLESRITCGWNFGVGGDLRSPITVLFYKIKLFTYWWWFWWWLSSNGCYDVVPASVSVWCRSADRGRWRLRQVLQVRPQS